MKKHKITGLLLLATLLFSGCGEGVSSYDEETSVRNVQSEGSVSTEEDGGIDMNEKLAAMFKGITLTESYKGATASNPLYTQYFGADPYALVYDGRLYIYMTADAFEYDGDEVKENSYQQINTINVISTTDMVNFTDHGYIQVAGPNGAAKWAKNSWAPAAAWKNIDGKDKFFLYFADGGGGIGVLEGESPVGPFVDPIGKGLIRRDMPNCGNVLWLFDPAVLVDDDGRAYIYFGGGVPEGKVSAPGTGRVAELGDDMISIKGEAVAIDIPYLFEDSGIHKFNNKYYYTYCTNWQVDEAGEKEFGIHNAEIAMLESDSPMGPFRFKEVILQNPGQVFGLYGNNHHCVFNYKDQWYITYHARTVEQEMGITKGYRSTNIDAFEMGQDGSIGHIKMTYDGRKQIAFVDPYVVNNGATFAREGGIKTVPFCEIGVSDATHERAVTEIHTGDFIKVQGVDFGSSSPKTLTVTVAGDVQGDKAIMVKTVGGASKVLGYVDVSAAENGKCTMELSEEVTGVTDVMFVFCGEGYQFVDWKFEK